MLLYSSPYQIKTTIRPHLAQRFNAETIAHALADVNQHGKHEDVIELTLTLRGVTMEEPCHVEFILDR